MYPHGELAALAERKRVLLERIAARRVECAAAAGELARPVALADRGIELWHRIAPFLKALLEPLRAMAAQFVRRRRGGRGGGKLGMLLAALPVILRGIKLMAAVRARRRAAREEETDFATDEDELSDFTPSDESPAARFPSDRE